MNTRRRPPLAEIPIDTLGKLADGAYRLSGHCLICRKDFDVAHFASCHRSAAAADQWRTPRTIEAANDRADRDR
jgi:hypothetical protein